MSLSYTDLVVLTGNALGRHDVACPECGPERRAKINQKRDVLRIWLKEDFATFKCARCDVAGHAFADQWRPVEKSPVRAPAPARDDDTPERQRGKAQWLWSKATSIGSTPAASYLRTARGIDCHLHSTLRYLRPRKPEHHHALIAPFAIASEPEPGVLHVANADIHGIHLTLLRADGSGKAETEPDKIMIGPSNGWPIILAPPNDSLALGIAEGIETALSAAIVGPSSAGKTTIECGLGYAFATGTSFFGRQIIEPMGVAHIVGESVEDIARRYSAIGFHTGTNEPLPIAWKQNKNDLFNAKARKVLIGSWSIKVASSG